MTLPATSATKVSLQDVTWTECFGHCRVAIQVAQREPGPHSRLFHETAATGSGLSSTAPAVVELTMERKLSADAGLGSGACD